ncbi:hypothetical protein GJ744_011275 [Endocarpon pusillum]|uniref:Folliculin-interacting protein N-terminal domain-containing protein n=1 Tax=Endocarpon pusillum TaxID=364733 RepID=A0A8H7E785_9EURO|nr:hypothetical protein GJ744_011275 [Endocarpon pusillum]
MLGRLFGNAASSVNTASYSRDSIVDEEYTRGLLYPDYAAPQHGPAYMPQLGAGRVGDFDEWGGLELDALKDFRIMVAQDALGDSEEPCILFDTQHSQQPESLIDTTSRTGILQTPTHRRGGSTTSNLRSPTSPLVSKPQPRIPPNSPNTSFPVRNRSSTFSGASDEHDPRQIRISDSKKEETRDILSCAFGSSAGASSGTKMHFLSLGSGTKELPVTPVSPGVGGNLSAGYFRKREPIARAHTSALFGFRPPLHERSYSSSGAKPGITDAVLITKLFSVNLPEPMDLQALHTSTASQGGSAIPNHEDHSVHKPATKGKKPRAKKTPVFAIILIVQLPANIGTISRPSSRGGMQTPPTYTSMRSFRNSFNSQSTSPKLMSSAHSRSIDRGDARVNALVEHWDIIDRALTLLENVSTPKILNHLKHADSFSAAFVSKPSKPKEKTMQRTNQINIYLSPQILGLDPKLKDIALQTIQRIRRALRIPRVTIGPGRWGLWNDELIRVVRCQGGREQSSFVGKLLTAFLGTHTAEWMPFVAPSGHRRQHSITRKTNDLDVISTRTIIVSNDRSAARRLIFLLASFLIGDFYTEDNPTLHGGPGSAVSLRNALHNSPSTELLKTSNGSDSPEEQLSGSPACSQGGLLITRGLQHKPSDIRSVKSIPIPANDLSLRKSSAATTSTVTPDPTTPIPEFSPSLDTQGCYVPNESSASARLTKIWQTANKDSESGTTSTKFGSRWSGFWSKDSSGTTSGSTAPSASSSIRVKNETPLDTMVRELSSESNSATPVVANESAQSFGSLDSEALPLRLQVYPGEKVIDVDIGLPGFLSSSNDSGLASPPFRNIRHASSAASLDSLASSMRHVSPKAGSRAPSRVAGFLPRFHPDYSLQAVRVSKSDLPDMVETVKSAMLSEPYPQQTTTSGWVGVATTLIANVQTASVKRLRLKRKIYQSSDNKGDGNAAAAPNAERSTTPFPIKPCAAACGEFVQEQAFSYESVVDFDPLLIEVVDRILARGSAQGSRSISPATIGHSRHVSTTANDSSRRSNKQSMLNGPPFLERFSRGPTNNLVIEALEDVVKTINHDLSEALNGHNATTHTKESAAQRRKSQDNALSEGVKSWLLNAEHAAVW